MANIVCGVDVSAERLDARVGPEGAFISVARSPEGIAALAGFCKAHGVDLVVMEATGGYEKLPFALLWAAGVRCAILNPRSVRRSFLERGAGRPGCPRGMRSFASVSRGRLDSTDDMNDRAKRPRRDCGPSCVRDTTGRHYSS